MLHFIENFLIKLCLHLLVIYKCAIRLNSVFYSDHEDVLRQCTREGSNQKGTPEAGH